MFPRGQNKPAPAKPAPGRPRPGKISGRPGRAQRETRLREPAQRRKLTKPGRDKPQSGRHLRPYLTRHAGRKAANPAAAPGNQHTLRPATTSGKPPEILNRSRSATWRYWVRAGSRPVFADSYYARRMASTPFRYQSPDEDTARWLGFPFRDGDIVVSARSKTGTTWVQMICALLIFQTPKLPAPLAQLSPWLDHLIVPREEVYARLAAQQHRRFIKTHTPLDGIPLHPRATYIVTARHPLDMAVSLYHQGGNIDRARVRQLTGQPEPAGPPPPRPPLHDWLLRWIAADDDPREHPDSLPGVMWHLSDAWSRRGEPNVLLVHYDNLSADPEGQMRWLAGQLATAVPEQAWPALVQAATFDSMRGNAATLVPTAGIFKNTAAFFRRGTSGEGHEILSGEEITAYHNRAAQLAPPDMLTWLHSPHQGR
jgi:aryl sulfotransferase